MIQTIIIFIVGIVIGTILGMTIKASKVNSHIRGNVAVYYIPEDDEQYMMLEIFPGKQELLKDKETMFKIKIY